MNEYDRLIVIIATDDNVKMHLYRVDKDLVDNGSLQGRRKMVFGPLLSQLVTTIFRIFLAATLTVPYVELIDHFPLFELEAVKKSNDTTRKFAAISPKSMMNSVYYGRIARTLKSFVMVREDQMKYLLKEICHVTLQASR